MNGNKKWEKDKPIPWKWRLPFIILLPISIFIQWIASKLPDVVEISYSQAVYRILLRIATHIIGWFPFSLFEFLLYAVILWILWIELRAILLLLKRRRSISNIFLHGVVNTLAIVSLIYALFILLFGLNYQRVSFAETSDLDTSSPSIAELKLLCEKLITNANSLREQLPENDRGVMRLKSSRWDALKRAPLGFQQLGQRYKVINGSIVGRPKGVIFSSVMSYFGLSGLYSIYTWEPSINMKIPHHNFAFATCHEMAHQMGFAAEDEANFIGYLACKMHPDIDFQYAGNVIAMRYALNALRREDHESFSMFHSLLSEGIKRDLKASIDFWSKYRTPLRRVSRRVNDTYLKSQGQKEGVASYGKVVDLLIAEQRAQTAEAHNENLTK